MDDRLRWSRRLFSLPPAAADLAVAAVDEAERIAVRFLPDALPRLPELILRYAEQRGSHKRRQVNISAM